MGIYLNTYTDKTVTAIDDALIRETLYGPDGIIFYGFDVTASSNILTVSAGRGVMCGRSFTHTADEYRVTLPTIDTLNGRVYLHLDLSNADAPLQLLTTTAKNLPALIKQSNVNVANGVYEIEIATFTASPNGITNIKKSITNGAASPIILKAYPVGSIYMSVNNTNPSTLFGGTWAELTGKFLLGRSSSHAAGTTGGAESITLTKEQLPAHTHTAPRHTHEASTTPVGGHNHNVEVAKVAAAGTSKYAVQFGSEETVPTSLVGNHTHAVKVEYAGGGATSSTGSGEAVGILPPYLAVYMWKRIA